MKLANVSLSRFRNEEHFQFITDFITLLDGQDLEALHLDVLYPALKTTLADEQRIIEHIRKPELTQTLRAENEVRAKIFRTIGFKVKSQLGPGNSDSLVQSAQSVRVYVHHYRKPPYNVVSELNATFRNFINDLRKERSAEISALSLAPDLNLLERSCDKIEALMGSNKLTLGQRLDQAGMLEVRRQVDRQFQVIRGVLTGALLSDPSVENMELKRSFNGLAQFHLQALKKRYPDKKMSTTPTGLVELAVVTPVANPEAIKEQAS